MEDRSRPRGPTSLAQVSSPAASHSQIINNIGAPTGFEMCFTPGTVGASQPIHVSHPDSVPVRFSTRLSRTRFMLFSGFNKGRERRLTRLVFVMVVQRVQQHVLSLINTSCMCDCCAGQFNNTYPLKGGNFCSDFSLPHCHHHGPQVRACLGCRLLILRVVCVSSC